MKFKMICYIIFLCVLSNFCLAEYPSTNATGYNDLLSTNITYAVYFSYENALGNYGLLIPIIFVIFQFMLLSKTRSVTLGLITSLLVVGTNAVWGYMSRLSAVLVFFYMAILFAIMILKFKK